MIMTEQRRIPTREEAADLLAQGIIDETILKLSDDELRKQLAPYRDDQDDEDRGRRSA